jgi:hypothetical protein
MQKRYAYRCSSYSYGVAWAIVLLLLLCGTCAAQQFRGAYGYAPYGGYMTRRSPNVLYGGIGTYYGGYQVGMGSRAYYVYGYRNTDPRAKAYLRWRRQHRGQLDRPLPYTMLDWERDLFNSLWQWEQMERDCGLDP